MMRLLWQFWPVFLPLIVYVWWQWRARKHARRAGDDIPGWMNGPWFWTVLAAMAMAVASFLAWGLTHEPSQGQYVPPRVEEGRIVPGHTE